MKRNFTEQEKNLSLGFFLVCRSQLGDLEQSWASRQPKNNHQGKTMLSFHLKNIVLRTQNQGLGSKLWSLSFSWGKQQQQQKVTPRKPLSLSNVGKSHKSYKKKGGVPVSHHTVLTGCAKSSRKSKKMLTALVTPRFCLLQAVLHSKATSFSELTGKNSVSYDSSEKSILIYADSINKVKRHTVPITHPYFFYCLNNM